jgi:hypothetical protein
VTHAHASSNPHNALVSLLTFRGPFLFDRHFAVPLHVI